jgi:hypothetical protein
MYGTSLDPVGLVAAAVAATKISGKKISWVKS